MNCAREGGGFKILYAGTLERYHLLRNKESSMNFHLILWGFYDEKIFVDARITIVKQNKEEIESVKGMELRQRFNPRLEGCLFRSECSMEDIIKYVESYNTTGDQSILNKLKEGRVVLSDLYRKREETNGLEFFLHDD